MWDHRTMMIFVMMWMVILVMMIDREVQEINDFLLKPPTLQVVDYVIERECELTQVKKMFKKKVLKSLAFSWEDISSLRKERSYLSSLFFPEKSYVFLGRYFLLEQFIPAYHRARSNQGKDALNIKII